MTGKRVAELLDAIAVERGYPKSSTVENGAEFYSQAMDSWAYRRGVHVHFIRPGKPAENAYAESFNGKFRDECLNENWFITLPDARSRIKDWRLDCNRARPHSGLDSLTPLECALRHNSAAVDAA